MLNYNLIGYAIYLPLTFYITIVVGKICHTNGEYYLLGIIQGHPEIVKNINNLLLVGYYLLNLGYAAATLSYWPSILDLNQLIGIIGLKLGQIILLLGVIHYINMLVTYLFSKRINKTIKNK